MSFSPYKKGRVYEDHVASQYGKRQPGSGSHSFAKEDIKGTDEMAEFLIQTKNASGQKTYTLKLEDLKTLRLNASKVGKTGLFMLNFGEGQEFMLLRRKDFDYLFREEDSKEN